MGQKGKGKIQTGTHIGKRTGQYIGRGLINLMWRGIVHSEDLESEYGNLDRVVHYVYQKASKETKKGGFETCNAICQT